MPGPRRFMSPCRSPMTWSGSTSRWAAAIICRRGAAVKACSAPIPWPWPSQPLKSPRSCSVAAYGKVRLKAQRGEAMPVGWMIDREGKPLTDPKRADEGYLLPIGDYKGYGLSLIIALLAGALNRAAIGREVIDFVKETGKATNTGQAIMALSIEAFTPPAEFKKAVDAFIRDIRQSQRLPGLTASGFPASRVTPSSSTVAP